MRAQTASCPYTGLWPFTADDRHYFFGRASDAKRIAQSISSEGLTILYGPSGVGKSSILGAALPQALQEAFHSPLLVLSVNRWDRDPTPNWWKIQGQMEPKHTVNGVVLSTMNRNSRKNRRAPSISNSQVAIVAINGATRPSLDR